MEQTERSTPGWHGQGGLSRRIAAMVLLGVSLLCATFTAVSSVALRRGLRNEFEERIASLAENAANTLKAPLGLLSPQDEIGKDMQDLFRPPFDALAQRNDIVYAALMRRGKPVVHANQLGLTDFQLPRATPTSDLLAGKYAISRASGLGRASYEIRVPVRAEDPASGEILVGYSDEASTARMVKFIWTFALTALLGAVLLSLFILGYIKKTVTLPLSRIMTTADQAAGGDLTVGSVDILTQDEIGQVGRAFNKMLHRQKEVVGQIQGLARNVLDAANDLAQFTRKSTENSVHVSQLIGQISAATSQMAQNAQSSSASAQAANTAAIKGREVNETANRKMESIQVSVVAAVDSIKKLARSSAQINEIIGIISKIADQTNLLSLNAAIEAARAGEAGRGFAVVADEVRKLAESSSKSAQEISQITQLILKQTDETSQAVSQGGKDVAEGAVLVKDALTQFMEITRALEEIARQIEYTAASSEETAASTGEVKSSAEEGASAIEKIAAHCASLSGTSAKLNEIVGQFKVA